MNTKTTPPEFETVVGLEVHLQFHTRTKIFCGCANEFGRPPNTNTCPVCLGLPGTLPVFNKSALDFAIRVALALNCEVNAFSKFDRKNYYYPDLPKGYQVSQYDQPVASNGYVALAPGEDARRIRVNRAHLEEDAGKLVHDQPGGCTLVDYNRTGTPLLEIVTEPDIRSPQEAYDYLTTLKLLLQYLNVSDCDMEKGSLRCDANISLRPRGQEILGTKTELKNMNSFKAVKAALEYEVKRQSQVLKSHGRVVQETRLWDEQKQASFSMRSKEEAHDYRYFPEPDLVPFIISSDEIERVRQALPEIPWKKLTRFQEQYQLSEYDAQVLIQDQALADLFEDVVRKDQPAKKVCNWIMGPVLKELNEKKAGIRDVHLQADDLAALIAVVEKGEVSNLAAKDVLREMIATGRAPGQIIADKGLAQVSDDAVLTEMIETVLDKNPEVVDQIRSGKEQAFGFLIGQAMKMTKGKANPKKVGEIIKRRLSNDQA